MATIKFTYDPADFSPYSGGSFKVPSVRVHQDITISDIKAKITNTGETCKLRVAKNINNTYFAEDESDEKPTQVFTSEFGGFTDKISTGYLTDWKRLDSYSTGTSQSNSGYRPQWLDNRANGFPAIRFVVLDHVIFDNTIQLRTNQEWTVVINLGPYTPSMFGCCLGSTNTSSSSIKTAYHWAGVYAKLRHDAGGEFQANCNTGTSGEYFGGPSSIHILRCDGNDGVSIRVNGQYTASTTFSSTQTYNFEQTSYYKTTSTQRYGNFEMTDLWVFDAELTDTECQGLEGSFASKYDTRDIFRSNHPWASGSSKTSSDAYNTPKTAASTAKTNALVNSLGTSDTSLSIITGETAASTGDVFSIFLDDYSDPGDIVVTITYTED